MNHLKDSTVEIACKVGVYCSDIDSNRDGQGIVLTSEDEVRDFMSAMQQAEPRPAVPRIPIPAPRDTEIVKRLQWLLQRETAAKRYRKVRCFCDPQLEYCEACWPLDFREDGRYSVDKRVTVTKEVAELLGTDIADLREIFKSF